MDNAKSAAELLLRGWEDTTRKLEALPPALTPQNQADAYQIQEAVMGGLGKIGGWKVGATGPDKPPSCAPMPATGIHESPMRLSSERFLLRGIEAEIAFRVSRDLPPREQGWTAAEVAEALSSAHPAIEVLESRFFDPDAVDAPTALADSLAHGAFVVGPPIATWRTIDFASVSVRQEIDGAPTKTATGNPAGDMLRLVVWLANTGAVWAGGLKAGQIVTCGSWTGKTYAGETAVARVSFDGAGVVEVSFGAGSAA